MNTEEEFSEREKIIQLVEEGKNTEYWKILEGQIKEWRRQEMLYLDSFKKKGIRQNSIEQYNKTIERIEYLERLLNVNESILDYNKSVMSRIKSLSEEIWRDSNNKFKGFLSQFSKKGEK